MRRVLCLALTCAALGGCKDTFKDSELTAAVRPLAEFPIPDTMTRTQVTEAAVVIESEDGNTITEASLTWESSDDRVVQVTPTETGHRATLTATGSGKAEITVRITGGVGAVPQTLLRDSVLVLERWLSVGLGGSSGCAINVDSIPYCWGFPLGDGTSEASARPVKVRGLVDFPAVHLELGSATSCTTVFRGGAVYCWGKNEGDEIGISGGSPSLVAIQGLSGLPYQLQSISAGGSYFCGTFFDRADQDLGVFVSCWGVSFLGQLGTGIPTGATGCTINFRTYSCVRGGPNEPLLTGDVVSAGETHACAIQNFDIVPRPGVVYCWGATAMGQAGPGQPGSPIQFCPPDPDDSRDPAGIPCLPTPTPVDRDLRFVSISAGWDIFIPSTPTPDFFEPTWLGESHTCGIVATGEAYCWGKNDQGQLGAPSDSTCQRPFLPEFGSELPADPVSCRSHPAVVAAPLSSFKSVSAGSAHTCGIGSDDVIYCWGSNEFGQLGDGTGGTGGVPIQRMAPVPIASDRKFISISSGPHATCGLTDDGSVYCWGSSYGTTPTRLEEPL